MSSRFYFFLPCSFLQFKNLHEHRALFTADRKTIPTSEAEKSFHVGSFFIGTGFDLFLQQKALNEARRN
jgi:hypothetical protein